MPMPVSVTTNSTHILAFTTWRRTCMLTAPPLVNLPALLSRLSRHCRIFIESDRIIPAAGSTSTRSVLRLRSMFGRTAPITSSISACTANSSMWTSILPASIFEMSRMSLMSPSRCLPAERMRSTSAAHGA